MKLNFAKIQWISAAAFHERLTPRHWRITLGAMSICLLPLIIFFPPQIGAILLLAVVAKGLSLWLGRPSIALAAVFIVFPLSVAVVISGFWQVGLTHSFLALLAVMSVCKMLESRNVRDTRILFLINLVLMLSFLMFSQSVLIFLYLLLAVAANMYAQLQISQRDSLRVSLGRWRDVGKLLLLALPFTIIVFFTFPRFDPIWGLPRQNSQGITGLPEEMSMDGLSSLAQSDEITFRVQFADGNIPRGDMLYWRGPVLWHYDGNKWQQREEDQRAPPEPLHYDRSQRLDYTLTIAKNDLIWLPALEMQIGGEGRFWRGSAHQIRLPRTKRGEERFQLTAATRFQLQAGALPEYDRRMATQLPPELDLTRTRALAQELYQAGGSSAAGFAEQFLAHIRNNEFYYTLEPIPGAQHVENFLFGSSFGFCQHYANAMAVAARSVDIPSRVIIGYQGGTFNAVSGDFVVREEQAHAWVELWLEGQGWTRFDPTAAVAPWRVESGGLSSENLGGAESRSILSRFAEQYTTVSWLRDAIDAGQAFWQNWVINLNNDRQGSLLGLLGKFGLGAGIVILLIGGLVLGLLWLLWHLWRKRVHIEEDAVAKAMRRLLLRLEKRAWYKSRKESVSLFLRRIVKEKQPKHSTALLALADAYEQFRYQERGDEAALLRQIRYVAKL